MRIESAVRPVFARHESFHPRYGWLKKAVDAAAADSRVFLHDDAVVTLGVGKNMVRAIKHWGLATGVLTAVPNPARPRMPLIAPTNFGVGLLGDDGFDPYCEDLSTVWALHWRVLSPECLAPVWWVALHEFPGVAFSQRELEDFVVERVSAVKEWEDPHAGSVRKDVACFLRMYTAAGAGQRATKDDVIDCPFRPLGLVRCAGSDFRFDLGRKPGLAPKIVLWACLDYMSRQDVSAKSVTVSRLASEPGAPGKAFRLTEEAIVALLEEAVAPTGKGAGPSVSHVAGIAQLRWSGSSEKAASSALWSHYARRRRPAGLPMSGTAADAPYAAVLEATA